MRKRDVPVGRGLSRNELKYLAIAAMAVDHIAWAFVPLASAAGMLMHLFGRLTGPLMAYFLAEGFHYTHDVRKYAARLGVFALISWIPFSLFEAGKWPTTHFGVIYTLFLGLLTLIALYGSALRPELQSALAALFIFLSIFGDWPVIDVVWPVIFTRYRDDAKRKWLLYSLVGLFCFIPSGEDPWWTVFYNLGIFIVPFLIQFCYNGKAGRRSAFQRWFFYIFYPAHLLVLYFLKVFL